MKLWTDITAYISLTLIRRLYRRRIFTAFKYVFYIDSDKYIVYNDIKKEAKGEEDERLFKSGRLSVRRRMPRGKSALHSRRQVENARHMLSLRRRHLKIQRPC